MNCRVEGCDQPLVSYVGGVYGGRVFVEESETLVGYGRERNGHVHDDNCRKRTALCAAGHAVPLALRRTCAAKGCTWRGNKTCFCHPGPKVEAWPVLPIVVPEKTS